MSSFNFSPTANQAPAVQLIPAGTPALTVLTVKEVKRSNNSGGLMAQLEFTIARGPYERRKIWMFVGDPNDEKNSEKWRPMCLATLQHLLESCGIFDPANPDTYARYANVPAEHAFTTILQDLDGKHVAIKIKIEKGTDGNDDRNAVSVVLSPNPNGRTAKGYADVQNGEDTKVPAPSPAATAANSAASAFGTQAAGTPSTGGFGAASATPTAQNAPAASAGSAPSWLQS